MVHNCNGVPDSEKRLRLLNNGVELEEEIKFLGTEIILTEKAVYDNHTMNLCHTAVLNAWDRREEVGTVIGSVTQVIKGPKEAFSQHLQRLTSAVNRMVPKLEVDD